jgi:hypothetical protein
MTLEEKLRIATEAFPLQLPKQIHLIILEIKK